MPTSQALTQLLPGHLSARGSWSEIIWLTLSEWLGSVLRLSNNLSKSDRPSKLWARIQSSKQSHLAGLWKRPDRNKYSDEHLFAFETPCKQTHRCPEFGPNSRSAPTQTLGCAGRAPGCRPGSVRRQATKWCFACGNSLAPWQPSSPGRVMYAYGTPAPRPLGHLRTLHSKRNGASWGCSGAFPVSWQRPAPAAQPAATVVRAAHAVPVPGCVQRLSIPLLSHRARCALLPLHTPRPAAAAPPKRKVSEAADEWGVGQRERW